MNGLLHLVVGSGGLTVVAIAVLSFMALAVAVERAWRLMPLRKRFVATRSQVTDALLRGAQAGPIVTSDAMARVLLAGLSVRGRGPELVRVAALDAAQREVPDLERGLGMLLITAQVAPLLGLLGTVIGLIEAFQSASSATTVTPAMLAGGLYKALGATVAGLWVAIPAYVAYGAFSSLAGKLVDQLEHAATHLPVLLQADAAAAERPRS
jgi:biopolymer transport protein ExbB